MKIHWPQYHFELILTADHSPSLQIFNSQLGEAMHHSAGAYSETQQIYGDPLRQAIKQGRRSAVSVGLGLGYNEILVACEARKAKIRPSEFFLLSFESEKILRDHFLLWLSSTESDFVYDRICDFFLEAVPASARACEKQALKDWLYEAQALGHWQLKEALSSDFATTKKYEVIFYDAFSSKTSPELWQEEFLISFFRQISATHAQVCSYACTGSLNRALKKAGFEVISRKGFHGKRNSTWAVISRP